MCLRACANIRILTDEYLRNSCECSGQLAATEQPVVLSSSKNVMAEEKSVSKLFHALAHSL
jgi:hypothetical protein